MPDRVTFQHAINAHPRERGPQLVYADWLEEQGDPQAAYWRGGNYDLGLGGLGGRGGRGGLGGLGDLLKPENPIMLIPGENAMVFLPHGYGFSVLVGHVAQELAHGWIVEPCREVIATNNGDNWVALAAGKNKRLRAEATFGELIPRGARVPFGCFSLPWQGDLPD